MPKQSEEECMVIDENSDNEEESVKSTKKKERSPKKTASPSKKDGKGATAADNSNSNAPWYDRVYLLLSNVIVNCK